MSQAMSHNDKQVVRKSKSSSPKSQHSVTINGTENNKLIDEHQHRSSSVSNGIGQIIGFIRRKFSRINDEEKQEFDDLKQIK